MRSALSSVQRSHAVLFVLVVVVGGLLAAVVPPSEDQPQVAQEGTVVGRPSLELSAPDNRVEAGQRVALDVFVANGGDLDQGGPAEFERRVTTARNVAIRIAEDELPPSLAGNLGIETGTVPAGQVPPGVSGPFTFELVVGPGVPPGRYTVPIEVTYQYTNIVEYSDVAAPSYRDTSRRLLTQVTLVVEESAEITLERADGDPINQGFGTVQIDVSNTGSSPATDVGIRLTTEGGVLYFGEDSDRQRSIGVFIERLEPGSSRTVTVPIAAWNRATPGEYLLTATVTFRSASGVDGTTGPIRLGVVVNGTG